MIAHTLIDNFNTKIETYFASADWENKYRKSIEQINHDEPWLTLIACYSIFGNQSIIGATHLLAINELLNSGGLGNVFNFASFTKIRVEEKLPEIIKYRNHLYNEYSKSNFHLYPDRRQLIDEKIQKRNASFEGNTNLDLLIEGVSNGKKTTIFIEAKFLSDISYQVSYNPIRDQIIRNIDCGIDFVENKMENKFNDFYFFLLTPKIFRTKNFSSIDEVSNNPIGSQTSRLYCYKMDEYKNPEKLKELLPHRNLSNTIWETLSNNIGWLAYDDFWKLSVKHSLLKNIVEAKEIEHFFYERNLL